MTRLKHFIREFISDESAISSVEYALLLAFIGAGIVTAATGLGQAVVNRFNTVAGQV